MDRNMNRNKSL